ncbi:MAG: hypothetical protein PVSMB7_17900 [Chloroflexota bacterium]
MVNKRFLTACSALFALALMCASVLLSPSARASTTSPAYAGKRITINIHRERLRAWVGNRVVLTTPVTTGNSILPTPVGHFTVFAKRSPYTFVSPWPKGSSKWYPTSTVSFALEFLNGGYFIHDAPWRGVFGRGSNSGTQAGTNFGGTHGCVNVPYSAAKFLYDWAPIGTPVHIVS